MNKWKIAFIALLTIFTSFVIGCAVSAKLSIPNLGILQPISWQSFDDPTNGGSSIHEFIISDKERNKEYIVIYGYRGLAITERLK
jgi:hypothetical protein